MQRWAQAVLRGVSACLSEVAAGCPTMDAGLRLVHAAGVPCSAEEAGEGPLGGAQPAAATAASAGRWQPLKGAQAGSVHVCAWPLTSPASCSCCSRAPAMNSNRHRQSPNRLNLL